MPKQKIESPRTKVRGFILSRNHNTFIPRVSRTAIPNMAGSRFAGKTRGFLRRIKERIVFLAGPTASGKTAVAACLAKSLKGEIICCDAMQIYQKMEIISSAPEKRLKEKIPHHLFGFISPEKEYNVARFRKEALGKIKEVIDRGKLPLFVGGTGLYLTILTEGIFQAKCQDEAIRRQLYLEAEKFGSQPLHARLVKVDPPAAKKIHPNDTKRLVRALEVYLSTGKPISQLQQQRQGLGNKYDLKIFCLDLPREELYQRINARVDKMFRQGLAAEVKKLSKLHLSKTAAFAIGVKEVMGYLEGKTDLTAAKELIKRNTRKLAKRQLTWFRKNKSIQWIQAGGDESAASIAQKIINRLYPLDIELTPEEKKWKELY